MRAILLVLAACGALPLLGAAEESAAVVRKTVPGSAVHTPRPWIIVTGKVTVKDGHTLVFADGQEVQLEDGPELEQLGKIADGFYPAGREARAFLEKLIGEHEVKMYVNAGSEEYRRGERIIGDCYVGDVNLGHELIKNGWALADHSITSPMEIMAREDRRGLWRGQFVLPAKWRKGERLPGEDAAAAAKSERTQGDGKPPTVLGTWNSIDRHVAIGSLYQPVHGVRKREGVVYFEQKGDGLTGYAVHADHKGISFQERWKDGRTDFRQVTFADNRLMFEFDIGQWRKEAGPLAVEAGGLENKGTIRVEAVLKKDRLAGTWKMFLADGSEVFRGEWEATRAAAAPTNELPQMGGQAPSAAAEPPVPQVTHDVVQGSIHHGGGNSLWKRVTGKARVIDATTLEFADGTRVELDITAPLPDQQALIGDQFYPCGQEAAEFLRKFVGGQSVMCIQNDDGGPWMGFVGDTSIERAMIVNGWALADHSSLQPDEIIARESKRGLWRGKFVNPAQWREGKRLPGEK
jgi:endonuclease YncB( thermonuclease family)